MVWNRRLSALLVPPPRQLLEVAPNAANVRGPTGHFPTRSPSTSPLAAAVSRRFDRFDCTTCVAPCDPNNQATRICLADPSDIEFVNHHRISSVSDSDSKANQRTGCKRAECADQVGGRNAKTTSAQSQQGKPPDLKYARRCPNNHRLCKLGK